MQQPSKRERLTGAAKTLFYQGGVAHTSLAEIAQAADVPLGNVYYHFNSKDALIEAVIASHAADIHAQLARFNAEVDPRARLWAYLNSGARHADQIVCYGCPFATLAGELAKTGAGPAQSAAGLLKLYLDWLERQFQALGRADAADLALDTLTGVQGSYVLAHATHEPKLLERQAERMEKWLEAV